MAIRESFRRVLRRSDESDSSSQPESNTATSSSKTSVSSKSSEPRLTRTWTWGSNKTWGTGTKAKEPTKERKPRNKTRRIVHPSEKPLTDQNILHQEMLSQFTWTFGASRPDQVEDDGFTGISPCCTRAPSIADYDPHGDSDRSSSSQSSHVSPSFQYGDGGR